MKQVFLLTFAAAFALTLGSCHQNQSVDSFDNNKVSINEMRASEKNSTIAGEENVAVINLQEHEAITSYTELVQGKLNTVVDIDKPSDVCLSVIDGDGQIVKTFTQASHIGSNNYQLDFSGMSLGQYYVVVFSNNMYRRFCVAKTQ